MWEADDSTVHRPDPEPSMGNRTDPANDVSLLDADFGEYGEPVDDYIDFVRSAGTCCRHFNRVRRRTIGAGAPGDFDD